MFCGILVSRDKTKEYYIMKKLLTTTALIAAIATSASAQNFGSGSSNQNLGRDTVHTSTGAACSQSLNTGKHLESGLSATDTGGVAAFFKVVMVLDMHKLNRIDCTEMYKNEVSKQSIELEKMQIELQMLKDQLAQQLESKDNKEPSDNVVFISNGDDW
mgnify:CR=1 FL=1